MAAAMACSTTQMLCNAPVTLTQFSGEPSSSSISRLHLRGQLVKKLHSLRFSACQPRVLNRGAPMVRASGSDNVRELASEKAVESGKQVADNTTTLANGQSPVTLDAQADDASDAASYTPDVREKVVDVASDMAVDTISDVDDLAKKDAEPLAAESGRSVEDTAEALESKAEEVSDREARKESA